MDGQLIELGLTPTLVQEVGIYPALLQVIDQRNLEAHHGTIDLVVALKAEVHVRKKGGGVNSEEVPPDKLSVGQFVHCLAFLASRCGLQDVSDKVKRSMWGPKMLEKDASQMRGDEVWPGSSYVPGVDMVEVNKAWKASKGGKSLTDTGGANEEEGVMVPGQIQFKCKTSMPLPLSYCHLC